MGEAQHTPGPWAYTPGNSVLAVSASNGRRVAVVGDAAYWQNFRPSDEADARLIAAAPELLAALQATVEEMSVIDKDEGCDHDVGICWCPWFRAKEAAVAAIAKATGRSL